MSASVPLLVVRQLCVHYPPPAGLPWRRARPFAALENINLDLRAGETLGIVGESGSGKSTLARTLAGLQKPSSGGLSLDGQPLSARRGRREVQMVFQDPLASLDPRMTAAESVAEPLEHLCPELSAAERAQRVTAMLERVGLPAALHERYPHEFSGGQCQRIGLARALVVRPKVLICDEPVSALDVSVQAQVINLLRDLQAEYGLAMVFIAHDLAVVRSLAHRVLVLYFGRVMETGTREALFSQPAHPYTRALLAARGPDSGEALLEGELPSPQSPPPGCAFATRCPMADEQCTRRLPQLTRLAQGGAAACHYV